MYYESGLRNNSSICIKIHGSEEHHVMIAKVLPVKPHEFLL